MSVEVPYIELKLSNKFLKEKGENFVKNIVDEILSVIVDLSSEQKRQLKNEITISSNSKKYFIIKLNINPLDHIWLNENIWNLSQKLCEDGTIKKIFRRKFNKVMREIIKFSYDTVRDLNYDELNNIISTYINIICIEVILSRALENSVYTANNLNLSLNYLKYEYIYTSLIDILDDFDLERLIELISSSNQFSKLSS